MCKIFLLVLTVLLLSACCPYTTDINLDYTNEEIEWDDSVITNCVVNNECDYESLPKKSLRERLFC